MRLRKATEPLFPLGHMVATAGVAGLIRAGAIDIIALIQRHAHGDWGLVEAEDAAANERALQDGSRLLSVYDVRGQRVWVITEADRSATTILFPHEY